MRGAALLLALCTVGVTGCAVLPGSRTADPNTQLMEGVAALEAREYLRARGLLEPLFHQHAGTAVGQRAMLVLIAAELDRRNPERRLWAGADMSARLLDTPALERWMVPAAEAFYLLAEELGAAEERAARADSARVSAEEQARSRALPTVTGETLAARTSRLSGERDQARRQTEQLTAQLAVRDRELREARQEIERLRRLIKD